MKSIIVLLALTELREATAFYADRAGVDLGLAFVTEFERVVKIIRKNPLAGTAVRVNRLAYPFRRFPYSVMYYLDFTANSKTLRLARKCRRWVAMSC